MTISSGIFQPHRRINSATSSDMRIDTYTHIFIYAYTHIYIYTYTYTYIYVHTYTLGPGPGPRALAPGLPGHTRAARQPRGQGPGPGPGPVGYEKRVWSKRYEKRYEKRYDIRRPPLWGPSGCEAYVPPASSNPLILYPCIYILLVLYPVCCILYPLDS